MVLYGGPDDEAFSHPSALDYLHERWAVSELAVGQSDEVAKYRRKRFELEVFERALAFAWDHVLEALEEDYACDDPIGLEDSEDEFVAGAAKLLFRLAKRDAVPRQSELVEVQTWTFNGANWKRA